MGGPAAVSGGDAQGYAHLIDRSKPWWKNTRMIKLNLCIALLLITSTTNGYDGSMMNGLQSLPQWNDAFNHPNGGKLGLLSAIQVRALTLTLVTECSQYPKNIGSVAAYPFSPYVSDGLGRRAAVLLGAVIMCIATVLQTASHSVGMFIGAR
ncbi:hypothetical protein ONZ51_g13350 [Trametes cubensis]|nr:hypothetical protein ONZ51_g13350 [Trametes cubensis]